MGVWDGGVEKSSVVKIPTQAAARVAIELARRNGQKSAIWFTPGSGNDVLHRLVVPSTSPKDTRRNLQSHGVTYATLTVGPDNTVNVDVIDPGGQLSGPVKSFADQTAATYTPVPGSAGFANT